MNGYICFYKTQRVEVYADTTLAARGKAAVKLRVSPKNEHQITVILAEKQGEAVTHSGYTVTK